MTARHALVPVQCKHCPATRRLCAVRHQPGCPADSANLAFFGHPDLMEFDLHLADFYPGV
ncbi:hypothetical protein GCM10009609_36460 [Pseudonocardia aurantiaca]|uniref:Uncharacterized protein n=1 Tax=Pseudonocardia aurantiaca TaxID=75290 RepID=A0ABW4FT45_9PSEU